jgi:hypothetical protein
LPAAEKDRFVDEELHTDITPFFIFSYILKKGAGPVVRVWKMWKSTKKGKKSAQTICGKNLFF